jgi:hypothetical protein
MGLTFRGAAPSEHETPCFIPGRKGLNWFVAKDQLDPEEALYRANVVQNFHGEMASRPGMTQQISGIGSVLQIQRLDLPASASAMRFWSGGTSWLRGNAAPSVLEGGFSGSPLVMLPYRPALSGEPWMIAADTAKMRQASATGPAIALGLPAPTTAASAVVADILTTGIAAFDSSDSTDAAGWTYTAGVDRSTEPLTAGTPTGADVTGLSGNCVEFTTDPGGAVLGYASIVGRAKAMDLTVLQGGTVAASAEDLIHLWLRVDLPALLEEIRIYFICSSFDGTVLPGTDAALNTDGFVKAIRGNDITAFLENTLGSLETGNRTRTADLITQYLNDGVLGLTPDTVSPLGGGGLLPPSQTAGVSSLPTQSSQQLAPGRSTWSEFGNIDKPLRRGDFLRFGNQATLGWDTITGIVLVLQTTGPDAIKVACDDWFLTGGYPLDTTEPTATPYDWRYTHYHLDTGDESNPSPEMSENTRLEALRQRATVSPVGYGDPRVRQRFYRRGGSIPADWYYVGVNAGDGAALTDAESDTTAVASATLALDNDQPVTTVTGAGATVHAQPLPVVFGPLGGRLLGLGDPYRPGHLYYSKVEKAGSWPPQNAIEVCPPSEELLAGTLVNGIGFILSRKRGYQAIANLGSGEVSVQETACQVGIASRWAWTQTAAGVYFVSGDADAAGIYLSAGQTAELLSTQIDPLFHGQRVEYVPGSYVLPVDLMQSVYLRLSVFQNRIFFTYKDTGGTLRCLVYSLLTKDWGSYDFAVPPQVTYAEEGMNLAPQLWLGCSNGTAHLHTGTTDNGTAIAPRIVTGYMDGGRPREDKLLGDVILDADLPTDTALTLTTYLNNGVVANAPVTFTGLTGRRRYQADPFGLVPQRARNLQLDLAWSGTAASALYVTGVAITPQPDQVLKRATTWESFSTERYFWGLSLVCDTADTEVECVVEYTQGNQLLIASTLTLQANGRKLLQFSWPAVKADQIRIRAISDCTFWMLFKVDWLATPEPPRIAGWDSGFENLGDSYYTGLDLEVDTFGAIKDVQVMVDGALVTNPETGLPTFPVQSTGRRVVHLTFGPERGHVYRFFCEDLNVGLLYSRVWHVDEEPSEQANWNQNYTVAGTLTNKSIKGVLIECDTYGQTKAVRVEGDGQVIATLAVNHNGRLVNHYAFPATSARVLRLRPTDAFLSRPYSIQWVYDEEPLSMVRWETQLLDHGLAGEHVLFAVQATIQSTCAVNMTITTYNNSGGLVASTTYLIPNTGGVKQKLYVPLQAFKGVLWKYLFTPEIDGTRFQLYREESSVLVLPWGATTPSTRQPFGSDDLDKVRQMGNASGIAATPNMAPPPPLPVTAGFMSGGDGVS